MRDDDSRRATAREGARDGRDAGQRARWMIRGENLNARAGRDADAARARARARATRDDDGRVIWGRARTRRGARRLTAGERFDDRFGGTCVGSAERIGGVCELLMKNDSKLTMGIVSAMGVAVKGEPKVTDCLINATDMAAKRDDTYAAELTKLEDKHVSTAKALLTDKAEYDAYIAAFNEELNDLRAMFKAIYIAGCSTDAFGDFVVGHGELWTARLCAATIRCKGGKAVWIDARDILVVTDSEDGGVDVDYSLSNANLDKWYDEHMQEGAVVMVTGFIARTPEGVPTTLKRNGSDYSATIFGALTQARNITIWTDVDGVFSADPRRVKGAKCLNSISYNEAWELAYFGANVLHPRTTLPAMKYNIPVTLRNYFNQAAPGTSIGMACPLPAGDEGNVGKFETRDMSGELVKGIATIDDVCLINVEGTGMVGVPGTANTVFKAVKEAGCNVVMISQASSEHSICFAVRSHEADAAVAALNKTFEKAIAAGRISRILPLKDCSILAIVGQNMCQTPGVSAMLFEALAQSAVNVIAIAQGASEYNITVVVSKKDVNKALQAAHGRFYLSKTAISVGLVGPGLVGKTLLRQMKEQLETLQDEFAVELRVVAITGGRKMLLSDGAIDLDSWEDEYASGVQANMDDFTKHVLESEAPNQIIVDCSASDVVAGHYKEWLSKGLHVVTPNKKANSGPLAYYKELRSIQRNSYTHYFYEGTVGAGLPIIATLQSLRNSGDKVERIEGIFSGTLSYIFNTLEPGKKFSDIVAQAKEAGYTEPDPRDDLSGMDVARKVTILARECGLNIELSDVPIQSLVPEPLRDIESVDEFMKELPKYDGDILSKQEEAAAAGEVLCFVGVVDVKNGTGSVELRRYPADHPFAQLKGSDNIVSFTTKYYTSAGPLVVRGPGAGAEVTAGGVFGDILRVCAYLGAPS
jgi:aspartokinase/homoserine dehydrogenase 1